MTSHRLPPAGLRAVLFDWDGTLVDSAELSYQSYVSTFALFGIEYDRDRYQATYSPDWMKTYKSLGLPEERWPEADRSWLALYAAGHAPLLPGAMEALTRLRARGFLLGVVTSGDRGRVGGEIEAHGLAATFGAFVGHGDYRERKPHPEGLLLALTRLGVEPAAAAYVGDSPEDIVMAQAAGVYAVGIPGGFPNRSALIASSPDLLAAGLEEAAVILASPGTGG
jgi:HAD superfamily hydrolase (TIGR01509 family)